MQVEDSEDQHIYSNIEFSSKDDQLSSAYKIRSRKDIEELMQQHQLLETDLDNPSEEVSESLK